VSSIKDNGMVCSVFFFHSSWRCTFLRKSLHEESRRSRCLGGPICLSCQKCLRSFSRDATATSQWILGIQLLKFKGKGTTPLKSALTYILGSDGLWRLLASLSETLIPRWYSTPTLRKLLTFLFRFYIFLGLPI
jgi:hypothetical protein